MIELTGVTKTYPDGTVAVDDFSAQFPPHKTTVLLGSSGSGKTTILRMVNRMVDASAGTITIDGEDIAGRDPVKLRRSIGYVMQNGGLLPHRSVLDNIATVPLLNGVGKAAAHSRARELMDLVGLDEKLARRYPASSRAASSSASASPAGWRPTRTSSSWTSRSAPSTPWSGATCKTNCSASSTRSPRPSCSSPTTSTRPCGSGDQIILLADGGHVAQRGTGPSLLGAPASAFVADFLGLDRGSRTLSRP
jgi:osmoprotectant transport system ATP-binding protein